jgi:hypothetical protein
MKKILFFTFMLVAGTQAKSQFAQSDLIYYVGSGPDTAVCVIDFLDGTADSSYAWGFLFNASATVTAEDMLNAIDADETKLDIAIGGGFLNDITYNGHAGISGTPNWWGTWSRTGSTAWASNTGIGEVLDNGDWFGCTYTDFSPAIEPDVTIPAYQSTKFDALDVRFWAGTGADSAVLVIDFVADQFGEQVSYAWGYLFDGSTDGASMLADIDAADINLDVVTGGGFLNDIYFNDLEGVAGTPYYWGTWSGTNLSDWTMNAGLSSTINPGDWFGVSYADWEPRRPFYPSPAQDSLDFTIETLVTNGQLYTFYGSGPDTAIIVIDYNESSLDESFAYGFLFDASSTVTAEDALTELNTSSDVVDVTMSGGFLNDISDASSGLSGIGGAPNYWSTWSSVNNGGWHMNAGISEELSAGEWFGCSYTVWSPATFPSTPVTGILLSGINELGYDIQLYPNPTNGILNIGLSENAILSLYDMNGRLVQLIATTSYNFSWDISSIENGMYTLVADQEGVLSKHKIVKQ